MKLEGDGVSLCNDRIFIQFRCRSKCKVRKLAVNWGNLRIRAQGERKFRVLRRLLLLLVGKGHGHAFEIGRRRFLPRLIPAVTAAVPIIVILIFLAACRSGQGHGLIDRSALNWGGARLFGLLIFGVLLLRGIAEHIGLRLIRGGHQHIGGGIRLIRGGLRHIGGGICLIRGGHRHIGGAIRLSSAVVRKRTLSAAFGFRGSNVLWHPLKAL